MLSDGLYALLTGASTVTAILATRPNSPATTGVFLVQMPEEDPVPAVVFSQLAGETLFSMDGPSAFRTVRWRFACYASTGRIAKQLQRAVRQVLEEYTGVLSDGSEVDTMECVLEMDAFEDAPFSFNAPVDMRIAFRDLGS